IGDRSGWCGGGWRRRHRRGQARRCTNQHRLYRLRVQAGGVGPGIHGSLAYGTEPLHELVLVWLLAWGSHTAATYAAHLRRLRRAERGLGCTATHPAKRALKARHGVLAVPERLLAG